MTEELKNIEITETAENDLVDLSPKVEETFSGRPWLLTRTWN